MDFWLQLQIDPRSTTNTQESEACHVGENKKWIVNDLKFSAHQDGFVIQHQGEMRLIQSGDTLEYGEFTIKVFLSQHVTAPLNAHELLSTVHSIHPLTTIAAEHPLPFLNGVFSDAPSAGTCMNPFQLACDVPHYSDDFAADVRNESLSIPLAFEPLQHKGEQKKKSFLSDMKQKFLTCRKQICS